MHLAITELYWPLRHGISKNTSKDIEGHFLVSDTISCEELYDGSYDEYIDELINEQNNNIFSFTCSLAGLPHLEITKCILKEFPIIKVYGKKRFHTPEIVDIVELKGGEQVAIKKTFWLKILQRKCRNYLKNTC